MRSCDETLELISAALDGALTGDEQTALDEHLSRCPVCSALFAELKSLRETSAELEDIPAPADFTDRVMGAIAADPAQEQSGNVVAFPAKKRSRTPWKGWAATAAVVAVVVLGAVTLPGQFRGNSTSSTADCAAPALENASAAPAEKDKAGEAESFAMISADDSGGARSSDAAEPESAFADQSAGVMEDLEQVNKDSKTDQFISQATSLPVPSEPPAAICGTITLTGEPFPAGLESYEYTEDEEGNRTYLVPTDYFSSCLSILEEEQPDGFVYEAGQENAGYGLIVVGGDAP